jgi:hypothetical protein
MNNLICFIAAFGDDHLLRGQFKNAQLDARSKFLENPQLLGGPEGELRWAHLAPL